MESLVVDVVVLVPDRPAVIERRGAGPEDPHADRCEIPVLESVDKPSLSGEGEIIVPAQPARRAEVHLALRRPIEAKCPREAGDKGLVGAWFEVLQEKSVERGFTVAGPSEECGQG